MVHYSAILALAASVTPALAAVMPRGSGSGMQKIPDTAKAPGTFHNGKPFMEGMPPDTDEQPPALYGSREIDLPFNRLYHGHLNFYKHTNDHEVPYGVWGSDHDNANQSACGIPSNAHWISGVGIHPHFLEYAGLDRKFILKTSTREWSGSG